MLKVTYGGHLWVDPILQNRYQIKTKCLNIGKNDWSISRMQRKVDNSKLRKKLLKNYWVKFAQTHQSWQFKRSYVPFFFLCFSQPASVTLRVLSALFVTRAVGSASVAPMWLAGTVTSVPRLPSFSGRKAAGVSTTCQWALFTFLGFVRSRHSWVNYCSGERKLQQIYIFLRKNS